jgi:hypothetical protein
MKIIIDDGAKLSEVQKEFSQHFPFLKLEFFNFDPFGFRNCSKENMITDTEKTIGDIRHVHRAGYISLNGHQKTNTIEEQFMENFGISVQVFRKSGNSWLETTTTDQWTLTEQNRKGEEMEPPVEEENQNL